MFSKKKTVARVFSRQFCEISKNTFLYRAPPVADSPQMHRTPNGDFKTCETYLKNILTTNNKTNKNFLSSGDFNINVLDFSQTKKRKILRFGMILTANKPTQVTKNTITAADRIIATFILDL